jgi:Leucine-rich repeat (LRR) protein
LTTLLRVSHLLARLTHWREYEFERVEALDLSGCAIDNLGFALPLQSLQELNVSGTHVTGRGLASLAQLPKLTRLSLAGSKASDLFAEEVGALTKLESLSLAGCAVSDAGLKHLAGMSHLTHLDLTGTQVTADGVAALQKALPKCRIRFVPAAK